MERLIFDCLGPRDLVKAKQVCKHWAISVKRYISQLDANRTSDLMKRAFLKPLTSFVIIQVPQTFRDLTINNRKEIYILGDDKVMQLDSVNFQVKKTMMFEWREEDYLERIKRQEIGYGNCLRIFANKDGSRFSINDPYRVYKKIEYRKYLSQPDTLWYSGDDKTKTRMVYNSDVICTKILPDGKKISKTYLQVVKTNSKAIYLIKLASDLYMYTAEYDESKLYTLIRVAHMSTIGTFVVKNVANIKMNPRYVKLRLVGTRVFCYENGMSFADGMKVAPENYEPRSKIVVFDIWNPNSVESDGILTKIVLQKTRPKMTAPNL